MRIDLISSSAKKYTFEAHALEKVHAALVNQKISVQVVPVGGHRFRHYLGTLQQSPPDLVITFSDPFPFESPIFEQMGIKHFYWNKGSLGHCLHYLREPLAHVGTADPLLAKLNDQLIFLPHACSLPKESCPLMERPFDVTFFDPLVDTAHLEKTWELIFSKEVAHVLHDVLDELKSSTKHPLEALQEHFPALGLEQLGAYLLSIEEHLKAQRTLRLVESLEDVDVHLFGEHIGNNWLRKLKNQNRVFLHWKLPYQQHFEVLKASKVLIRSTCPSSRGSDEWIFSALTHGCMPLTTSTTYLSNHLPSECFFEQQPVMKKDGELQELVSSASLQVALEHSYEKRVESLLAILNAH